ncbi:MAG: long-chain-fatty-acid--CoA ligase [Nocardioidaceae bacterium]
MSFTLVDLLRAHGRDHGDRPAVACGDRTLTYSNIDERSNRFGQALRADGLRPGSRVAYLDLNQPEFFDVQFGAAKLGSVVAPLNWRLTPSELGAIAADAEAELLVIGPSFADLAGQIKEAAPSIRRVVVPGVEYEEWLAAHDPVDPGFAGGPDDVVLQLYTSGTTGLPKGVMISNSNCSALFKVADAWSVDHESVSLVAMPLFHIGGSGWAMVGLAHAALNVLVPEIEPTRLLDLIVARQVSNAFLVPAVLAMLTAVPGAAERDYTSLRSLAYGASPITVPTLRRALEVFRTPLYQVYGLTETTGAITQLDADDHDPGGPREHLLRSAGRPYPWVELKTVDPVSGDDCAAGTVGEVWIRSVQVSPGYWRRPEETAVAVTPDGWLRTGDAGYVDGDGYLFLTDRIKDMIVTGAENVYPVDVENVLAGHPDVADVAVIGVPDDTWGETVKAVVVRRQGSHVGEAELLEFAHDRLAGFKRPRSVDFVADLPRNATGKLLKRVLREPYWAARGDRRIG